MTADQRLFSTPAGITLGPLDMVADGGARSIVIQMKAGRFHGFVVRRGDDIYGHVDLCPHAGLPLTQVLDDYLTPDGTMIACQWHGALFRIEDGLCLGGPCAGQALQFWPVKLQNGLLVTG